MTVKRRHCDWRKTMMIYSNNMIDWQHTCNVISNTNYTRYHGHSRFLDLSAWRLRIIHPGHFLTGGTPAERRGGRGAVPNQDCFPSTASSLLQRTSPEAGFQGECMATI